MTPSSFRTTTWDPLLIIAQILSLQSLCYLLLSLLLLVVLSLTGSTLTLDAILSEEAIRIDTVSGWTLALVWCIHAVLAIPVLVFVLQRAKLVLDFVVTMHGLHLVIVFMYRHTLPTSGLWWLLQIIHCLIMTLGGEWACMQQEMKPIFISLKPKKPVLTAATSATSTTSTNGVGVDSHLEEGITEWSLSRDTGFVHSQRKKESSLSQSPSSSQEPSQGPIQTIPVELPQEEQGPLTAAVGKMKKVVWQNSKTNKNKGSYDLISMKPVPEPRL